MRWYVSRAGETVGPLEEEELRSWARMDRLDGAQVRDEAGGAWIAAKQSPFGSLMKERGMVAPVVAGLFAAVPGGLALGVLGALAGFVLTFGALALYRRF